MRSTGKAFARPVSDDVSDVSLRPAAAGQRLAAAQDGAVAANRRVQGDDALGDCGSGQPNQPPRTTHVAELR